MCLRVCNGDDVFAMTFQSIGLHILASTMVEMISQIYVLVRHSRSKCPHSISKRDRRALTRSTDYR